SPTWACCQPTAASWRRSCFPRQGSRMSIIERAAELLRREAPDQKSRAAASDHAERRGLALIERAAADFVELTGLPASGAAPLEAEKTTRQFAVDRNRLRALGLITPDDERTPLAESFRRIKRQILANVDHPKAGAPPANLVLVTSALAGEG